MSNRWRATLVFVALWLLYQSAEGIGDRWLHRFPVQAGLMLACVVLAWPLSRWLGYRGYGAYALAGGAGLRWWLPVGLSIAVAAKFAAVEIGLSLGVYAADALAPAVDAAALLALLPMLLLSTFVPSVAEDILARGFWYRAARIRWRGGVAFVLASSAIYVLNHVYRLADGPLAWLTLFCFGLAYAAALWRSGSLWAAVGLHWGWNLGNHLVDAVLPVTVAEAGKSPFLSIAAHLLMLLLVCLAPRRKPSADAQGASNCCD
jgi:membrane protease YdiL (CAAX protease family)